MGSVPRSVPRRGGFPTPPVVDAMCDRPAEWVKPRCDQPGVERPTGERSSSGTTGRRDTCRTRVPRLGRRGRSSADRVGGAVPAGSARPLRPAGQPPGNGVGTDRGVTGVLRQLLVGHTVSGLVGLRGLADLALLLVGADVALVERVRIVVVSLWTAALPWTGQVRASAERDSLRTDVLSTTGHYGGNEHDKF